MDDAMKEFEIKRIFADPPILETPRLFLRKVVKSDYKDMFDYARDPEVSRYLLWWPHPTEEYTKSYTASLQKQYRMGEFFDFGICLKGEESLNTRPSLDKRRFPPARLIGTCGFTSFDFQSKCGEVGYVLHPDFWGRGIAAEAVGEIIRFGFTKLGLNRIEAKYMPENSRSRRVLEKCGMSYEGTARQSMLIKGDYCDIGCCSIIKSEYDERK